MKGLYRIFTTILSISFAITLLIYIDFYPENLVLPVEQFEISRSNYNNLTNEEKEGLDKISYKKTDLSKVPTDCINALVSIEDKYYWSNIGIDLFGLGRMLVSLIPGTNMQSGGSTITQQVIKMGNNRFYNRNILDKSREIIWSIKYNLYETKQNTLMRYLNNAYWGDYNYGIEQASQAYFNKTVSSLNLSQCSYLIGILQLPNVYKPVNNIFPVEGKNRQYWVLKQMYVNGYITQDEFDKAYSKELVRY